MRSRADEKRILSATEIELRVFNNLLRGENVKIIKVLEFVWNNSESLKKQLSYLFIFP